MTITPDTFPNQRKVHVLEGLPQWLKEPEAYKKVQKLLINYIRACKKTHSDLEGWSKCTTCQQARANRMEAIHRLGFSDLRQYAAWKKTHEQMRDLKEGKRVPLPKYNSV